MDGMKEQASIGLHDPDFDTRTPQPAGLRRDGPGSASVFGDGIPILDLRGLKCPLPVLRTRKWLRGMTSGDALLVVCTDPMAAIDIPHLLREGGDVLDKQEAGDGTLRFWLRRGPV